MVVISEAKWKLAFNSRGNKIKKVTDGFRAFGQKEELNAPSARPFVEELAKE